MGRRGWNVGYGWEVQLEGARRKGGRIPREWNSVAWVAFQIRTPVELKRELIAYALATGQSQQAIVTQALEAFLRRDKDEPSDAT